MIDLHFLSQAVAPATEATTQGTPPPSWFDAISGPFFPIIVGIIVLYFFMFRSKKTQDKKRSNMLAEMKKGDRVQTIGGILGTIVEVRDDDVLLKVDETSNAKIRFARSAIHHVIEEEAK
ncbi:MAG TPA: preprotein translocase subunit YajC [Tepidisphaeraceae bacterium]|nr:preprotein translocase subunit YajC [Tepidisphaeraceae bacterium]